MRTPIVLLAISLLAPLASAQEDPTVNESDFDTTPPPDDDAYLNESESTYVNGSTNGTSEPAPEDPTLSESDFDMSAPSGDEAYLDEAEAEYAAAQDEHASSEPSAGDAPGTSGSAAEQGSAQTPGASVPLVLVGAAAVALIVARRW